MASNTFFGTIIIFVAIYLVACKLLELIGYIDINEMPKPKEQPKKQATSTLEIKQPKKRTKKEERIFEILEKGKVIDKVFSEKELQQALLHYELQNKDVNYKEL